MLKKTAGFLLLASGTAMAAEGAIGFNNLSARYIDSSGGGQSGDGYGLDLSFQLTKHVYATADYSTRGLTSGDIDLFGIGIGGNYPLTEDSSIVLFGAVTWEQLDVSVSGSGGGGGGGGGSDPGADPGSDPATGEECRPTGSPADDGFEALNSAFRDETGFDPCAENPFKASRVSSKAIGVNGGSTDGFGVQLGIRAIVWDNLEANASYRYREYGDDDGNLVTDDKVYGVGATYSFGNWAAVLNYDVFDFFDLDEWSLGVRYTFGNEEGGGSLW